ncbi:DnaB family ATPase, partial [Neisseria sp. P0024.S002]|uniref:DnaB family ATPase n=1 Tax=Neisseria sp. P0024.S002 TaxID=3436846 RepID=UPI003F820CF9
LIVLFNLYILLKENLENVKITDEDKQRLSSREAAEYVYKTLSNTGYDIRIIRADSSTWSYAEIQSCILQFESQGYEIHLTLIDYLNLANKNGLTHSRADADIQELFRRTKNFFAAKNIALLTPVQLSPDAMELKRQGNKMLSMQISDGSYYEGCRGLSREPELEIFVDIVKDNGRKYQTFARGKHRGQNDTPEEHKFFILEFQKIGGLRWDINGTDTSLSKFGSVRNENGEEEGAFWDIGN